MRYCGRLEHINISHTNNHLVYAQSSLINTSTARNALQVESGSLTEVEEPDKLFGIHKIN
jgi:hypothetical protein